MYQEWKSTQFPVSSPQNHWEVTKVLSSSCFLSLNQSGLQSNHSTESALLFLKKALKTPAQSSAVAPLDFSADPYTQVCELTTTTTTTRHRDTPRLSAGTPHLWFSLYADDTQIYRMHPPFYGTFSAICTRTTIVIFHVWRSSMMEWDTETSWSSWRPNSLESISSPKIYVCKTAFILPPYTFFILSPKLKGP